MCGTDLGYAATQCALDGLSRPTLSSYARLPQPWYGPTIAYAMSVLPTAKRHTLCPYAHRHSAVLCHADIAYGAMVCAVLPWRMLLRVSYAMSGTELAYAATSYLGSTLHPPPSGTPRSSPLSPYALPGADLAYAATRVLRDVRTELAYGATSHAALSCSAAAGLSPLLCLRLWLLLFMAAVLLFMAAVLR
eukprot:2661816-Rhodomonas_salina.1